MSERFRMFKTPRSVAIDFGWRYAVEDTEATGYPYVAWCATAKQANAIVAALNKAQRRTEVIAAGMGRNPLRAPR